MATARSARSRRRRGEGWSAGRRRPEHLRRSVRMEEDGEEAEDGKATGEGEPAAVGGGGRGGAEAGRLVS